jgi:hypothetical protein
MRGAENQQIWTMTWMTLCCRAGAGAFFRMIAFALARSHGRNLGFFESHKSAHGLFGYWDRFTDQTEAAAGCAQAAHEKKEQRKHATILADMDLSPLG